MICIIIRFKRDNNSVAMDVRQVMGAVLTFSMFLMLGNMIKRDHFDGDVLLDVPDVSNVEDEFVKMARHSLLQRHNGTSKIGERLKLCWKNSLISKETEPSNGFVTFTLTNGPEYHVSQVANAVLVAKHLKAILVLPEIIGNEGEKRSFEEIYDAEKFVTSMNGVIQVEKRKRPESSTQSPVTVNVPYNANRNYIATNIEPMFQKTRNLRVITYFPSLTAREGKVDKDMNPYSCRVTFEALKLKPELQQVVDSIVRRLRNHEKPNGEFAAVDYKSEMMGTSTCRSDGNKETKSCYNLVEVARFFNKIGYEKSTTVYVTQPSSGPELNGLKNFYPNTFTKEEMMQEAEKQKFPSKLEREIIDFHICSVSDVFVPAKSGLFYANVVGNRIAISNTEVLVPAQITSTLAQDHVSSYISKRTHPAYACFCK